MATYAWESSGRKHHTVKKTGTVVFNPNTHVSNSFDDCKELSQETLDALRTKMNFTEFLPAQAQCFKGVSNGRDVILHSRTGSGKTLAYSLPVLERFLAAQVALSEDEKAMKAAIPAAPFMVIFVFGNELAVQTKSVIEAVYGDRVNVAVAGYDVITTTTPIDVLIGTLNTIDKLIRGVAVAKAADEEVVEEIKSDDEGALAESDSDDDLEDEADAEDAAPAAKGGKRGRAAGTATAKKPARKPHRKDELHSGIVSLSRVRSIVVDEVDVTMGPKFSTIGRRMKNLLKVIRKSNGSLTPGLTSDYRMHHYVLCGATIPNWVIKAGFLGVKKYYYRLVTAGDTKIPTTLECFTYMTPKRERVATVTSLVTEANIGRAVIFTTKPRVPILEAAIKAAIEAGNTGAVAAAAAASPGKKGSKKGAAPAAAVSAPPKAVLRTLSAEKDELERIACIEDYNSGVANLLLCTDSAARGLDFVAVDTVIMETLPDYVGATDMFVHRAGRTARVANAGRTILLADPAVDQQRIAELESVLHIAFKEYPHVNGGTATTTGKTATAMLSLKVKAAIRASKPIPGAAAVATVTPRSVLKQCVNSAKIVAVHDTEKPDVIHVEVKPEHREEVRKALWKYDVAIL